MDPYYQSPDGAVTIFHGDAREVLPTLPGGSIDLLLSDPPYGMAYAGKAKAQGVRADGQRQAMRLLRAVLPDLDRVLTTPAHAYLFCHWESLPDFYDAIAPYWAPKNALVWHKAQGGMGDTGGDYAHDYELILFAHKGRRRLSGGRAGTSVFRCPPVPGAQRQHPTQKPIGVLAEFIRRSSLIDEAVLDPFIGAGSTLVAAAAMGRRAVGIEVDERYCAAAARRVEDALRRRAARLVAVTPEPAELSEVAA